MQKWLGRACAVLFLISLTHMALAQEDEKRVCTGLSQAGFLSEAACSDPSLRVTAFHYAQTYYALKGQNTPASNQLLDKQLAKNNAALQHECNLPPTGPSTIPPNDTEKNCYIRTRQEQIAVLSRSLKGPFTQEAARPMALHIALQQKMIDDKILSRPTSEADGLYDTDTREAIKKWQGMFGDKETGALADDEVSHFQKRLNDFAFGTDRASRRYDVDFISFSQPLVSANKAVPAVTRIFQMDMLDITRDYLETITGPPKYVRERSDKTTLYTYIVDGCEVTAYGGDSIITGYALHVTPYCTIPMTPPGPHGEPPLSLADMTLEELYLAVGGGNTDIIGLCFGGMSCGNSGEISMGFVSWGAHYNDETHIAASASAADIGLEKVEAAADKWKAAMTDFRNDEEKDDYLSNEAINCDHRFDDAGIHAMRDVPVQYFFFGRDTPDIYEASSSACDEQKKFSLEYPKKQKRK